VPDDPDVRRLWTVAVIAKEFGVLPSVVARDLDRDAELMSLVCLDFLRYSEAKAAFDGAEDDNALKPWRGSEMMALVKEHTFEIRGERLRAQKAKK
jgi:hypothetical protein